MKGLPKNTIAWLLFCGSLAAPSAWGFETGSEGQWNENVR